MKTRHSLYLIPTFSIFYLLFTNLILPYTIQAQASYTIKTDIAGAAGSAPQHIVFGDINRDGKPDIVTANQNTNDISIFTNTTVLNSTTPAFSAPANFASGSQPHSVSLGDINGDGLPDIAVANTSSSTVSVFLNTTAAGAAIPTLAAKKDLTSASGPYSVFIMDMNGDGKTDIIAGAQAGGVISVFINTTAAGASTVSFSTKTDFSAGTGATHLWIEDFNNDGKADVSIAGNTAAKVSVFLNTTVTGASTPTFAARAEFTAGATVWSVTAADFNKDGKPDLAVANRGLTTMSVFINTMASGASTASFSAKTDFTIGSTPIGIIAADLNADGLSDIAVVNRGSSSVSLMYNTTVPGASTPAFAYKLDLTTASTPYFPAASDINGDGKIDIAVCNSGGNDVSIFLNTGNQGAPSPAVALPTNFNSTGVNSSSLVAGDINLDGIPDIVQGFQGMSSVSVLLNNISPGGTAASFAPKKDFTVEGTSYGVTLSDLNGDGKKDIIATAYTKNKVSVLLNTTEPGAATATMSDKTDVAVGAGPASVAAADLNGDGKPDLVTANSGSGNVSVLLNTTTPGGTTPAFASATNFAAPANAYVVQIKDINMDGRPDIIVAGSSSSIVSVLLNTTVAGAATAAFADKTDFITAGSAYSIAVTDLNGDGKADIAVVNREAGSVSVLLNTTAAGASTAAFSAKTDFEAGTSPAFITAGDFNIDGIMDLAVTNQGSSDISVLTNITPGGATTPSFAAQRITTTSPPLGITSGDISMDGKTEIIVAGYGAASLSAILNTTIALQILPVRFLILAAEKEHNNAKLSWKAADEKNVAFYIVQRSTNGIEFTEAGKVNAVNAAGIYIYSFFDNIAAVASAKNIFYRVQGFDKDGKITYSNIAVIGNVTKAGFTLFPNPAANHIIITGRAVSTDIFDATGRLVLHRQVNNGNAIIRVSQLSKGIYTIRVQQADGSATAKQLIVQ